VAPVYVRLNINLALSVDPVGAQGPTDPFAEPCDLWKTRKQPMNTTKRLCFGTAALIGLVIVGEVPSVLAEEVHDTGTETIRDRRACTPDVMHLCRTFIPNRTAITNCLVENIDRLSPACRTVIASRR
jgi:hypothetical protein